MSLSRFGISDLTIVHDCYRSEFAEAEALAQFSLDVSKSVYKLDENQIMLRRHR